MSRSLSPWQAALLGGAILVGLGLAAVGLFAVGDRQWLWRDTFQVAVGFDQVRGVDIGTRVRVQGIEAGEVVAVEPPAAPGDKVTLRLRLDGKMRQLVRADASAQIVSEGMLGGKAIEVFPGSAQAPPVQDNATLAARHGAELTDVLGEVSGTLQSIREGRGTLGKLTKDTEAHDALVDLLKQGKETMASIQEVSEAVERLPGFRSYVEDAKELLIRPRCERNRRVFAEADLFEPGQAVLTARGRQRLDEIAPWVNGLKHAKSDVVVVAYADPATSNAAVARKVTKDQSGAVCAYLKDTHAVHKMGLLSFARPVKALGCGTSTPSVPEKEALPPARVEVIVFVPLE